MSLYPTLEDMQVDKMAQAQSSMAQAAQGAPVQGGPPALMGATSGSSLYPSLEEYMGLSLSPENVRAIMPVVSAHPPTEVAQRYTSTGQGQIAPITGNDIGVRRAEVKQGVREIILCKDQKGKIGIRVRSVNKGIFVAFVHSESPASLAGLRFGDQILQINGENVAGWDTSKAMKVLTKAAADRIVFAVRDRPFERAITLQKDSAGTVGFVFKGNKITALVKNSSAARNGVLIEHHLLEVNGQNVVGLKEKQIKEVFDNSPQTVTITIIPTVIYEHIVKSMGDSLVRKHMDHSIPDA